MTAVLVGEVDAVLVGVTSDGRVWALGRSFSPDDADQLARLISQAAGLARSEGGAQDAGVEDGKFLQLKGTA